MELALERSDLVKLNLDRARAKKVLSNYVPPPEVGNPRVATMMEWLGLLSEYVINA